MTDKRLLTSVEIEAIWAQVSMKKISNATFRFAVEIAMAQLAKVALASSTGMLATANKNRGTRIC